MKRIAALLSLIIFLFVVKSSVSAAGYCNFSPEGANGQPYGDVTLSTECVIYESTNGVANGNLTLQNASILLNSTLVFAPGKQINIGTNSYIGINTNGKIQQSLLCVKDADSDGYADVITLDKDPASGLTLTNPITQIGKVAAPIGATSCATSNPGYINSELMNNLTMVDADPLTASSAIIATSDRELLRLGFMINGVTDVFAGTGDIQIVNKNLLVCDGASCPADNFLNLTPPKGNIYVGGKVGIGTTNPGAKLEVTGQVNISSNAKLNFSNGNPLIDSVYDDFNLSTNTDNIGTGKFHFKTNNTTEAMTISASNVGIGITNPDQKLTIEGGITQLRSGGYLMFRESGNTWDFRLQSFAVQKLGIFSGDNLTTPLVTFLHTGNVGIGTTSPITKLEVNGALKFSNTSTDTNDGRIGSGLFAAGLNLVGINSDSTYRKINIWGGVTQNQNDLGNTWTGNSNFPGSGIWNSSGNIGIGTTAPSGRLNIVSTTADSTALIIQDNARKIRLGRDAITVTDLSNVISDLYIQPDGDSILAVNSGNVGIGTYNPGRKLDVSGSLGVTAVGGQWISGKTGTGGITSTTALTAGAYHPLIRQTTSSGHVVNLGGLGDDWGFFGYDVNQTANAYNYTFTMDLANGNVGINTLTPAYKLQVVGSLYAGGSSREYKENIVPLVLDTSKIYQLEPKTYDYKTQYKDLGKKLSGGRQFGLVAEDVYQIYPELTLSDGTRNVANVDYEKLSVLLLVEMKKQKNEIDSLKKQVNSLEQRLIQIESKFK